METKSLYHIQTEYLQIAAQLTDGEFTPELEQALILNETELQNKGINYGFIIKQMEGECSIIDAEIDRLEELKSTRNKAIERLKNNLSGAMQLFGIDEIKTPLLKINFRSSQRLEVDENLPAEYLVEKITTAPDKKRITSEIKAGTVINGARLVDFKNIQIK